MKRHAHFAFASCVLYHDSIFPTAIDECLSNPCQHGTCENKLGSFHCECEAGYRGETCSQSQDLCTPELCKNGASCLTMEGVPQCQCLDGFSGEFCEIQKGQKHN